MTYLLDDSGNEIVLNTEVTVTKQVISFFNFKIKGNFSKNFGIPNTSATRRALGYYGVNQSEKVAFSNQAWNLYKDGNLLTRGYVVIQTETEDELDCFFASGNASWINTLIGNLRDLNWSDYDQTYSEANLSSLRSATTGMVFPLVDYGYNGKKLISEYVIDPIYDVTNDPNKFLFDFYPSFYLKTIIKEIAKQKQIKIRGNIFDDPVFDKMVIPLNYVDRSLKEDNYMTDNDSYSGYQYIAAGATATITFAYESNSTSLTELSTGRIQNDNRSRNVRVKIAFTFDSAFTGEVYLRKNGSIINTYNFTVGSFLRYESVSLAASDYLDVQVKNNSGFTRSITDKYFGYQICGSWYDNGLKILAGDVVPNMKIIDAIRYVVQAFNCIVTFDDFSRTMFLNKIDSVRKENAVDLTGTVIDYQIDWQNGFARQNYVRTNQTEDILPYNNSDLKFGEFVFDGPDNGKSQDDIIDLKFGPCIVKRGDRSRYPIFLTRIPLFNLQDDSNPVLYSTVTSNSGGYPVHNGLSEDFTIGTIVRIEDDNQYYSGYSVVYSSSGGSTAVNSLNNNTFIGTSTGKIYKQNINFTINTGFRVLLNYPLYSLSKIGYASINVLDGVSSTQYNDWSVAFHYIPESEFSFSSELKLGANPGEITNSVSVPLSTMYYKTLQKIARNPVIKVTFRLSETQFNTLDLAEFVYLDIGRWSGYFFIQKIDGYKDSITDVKAELLKVD